MIKAILVSILILIAGWGYVLVQHVIAAQTIHCDTQPTEKKA